MHSRIIILLLLIALAIYYYVDKYVNMGYSSSQIKEVIEDPPPDWTLDWGGGHGRDRFDIMTEPGPYVLPFDNQLVPLP